MPASEVIRWRLTVEYDGSAFAGWQLQPNAPTIQGAIEHAAEQVLGHFTRVHGAGRTDSGVHAAGQVALVETTVHRPERAMRDGLNAHLPPQIAILNAERVDAGFDPRHSPHVKTYRYRWLTRASASPLRVNRVWHLRRPLDAAAMGLAVAYVVGTHDFSAFRASGCSSTHAVRTVREARVQAVADDEVWLTVRGTGFLRHMIRILAGTLVEVGTGRRSPGWVAEVIASQARIEAGRTAPACGLLLVQVDYDALS